MANQIKNVNQETINGKQVEIGEIHDEVGLLALFSRFFGRDGENYKEYGAGESHPPHNHTIQSVRNDTAMRVRRVG